MSSSQRMIRTISFKLASTCQSRNARWRQITKTTMSHALLQALFPHTSESTRKGASFAWTRFPRFAASVHSLTLSRPLSYSLSNHSGKTIAPGVRLGWVTCSPLFAERLERMGETSTQSPCGLGQSLVVALLSQWTFDGYVRWLRGLRTQYKFRRDFFVDCLAEEFDLFPTRASAIPGRWAAAVDGDEKIVLFSAYRCGEKTRPLLSFVPPSAGMFVWVELYFGDIPDRTDEDGTVLTPDRQFWIRLADAGVLAAPGWFFAPVSPTEGGAPPADRQIGHMRFSYTPSDVSRSFFLTFRACPFSCHLLTGSGPNLGGGCVDGDDAPGH